MKTLLTVILIVGMFMVGYELGHRPGSPDLVTAAKKACRWCSNAITKLADKHAKAAAPARAQADDRPAVIDDREDTNRPRKRHCRPDQ